MSTAAAMTIAEVTYRYASRTAIDRLSLEVQRGEIFAFLGPNGSGKTTLFRLLSTLIPLQEGTVDVLGYDLTQQPAEVRSQLGVAFQAPSLDKKLSVVENLRLQGRLYGMGGRELRSRIDALLALVGMTDRSRDLTETLSGGLRRRVELAKAMLHSPRLLLLDEPSTGLDPGARADLWQYLFRLRDEEGLTLVLTSHLLDEVERADRLAILHEGRLAALDTPTALRASVGGDSITISTFQPAELAEAIRTKFELEPQLLDGNLRLEHPNGHQCVSQLIEAFRDQIESITLGKPTMEDVFIDATGKSFR